MPSSKAVVSAVLGHTLHHLEQNIWLVSESLLTHGPWPCPTTQVRRELLVISMLMMRQAALPLTIMVAAHCACSRLLTIYHTHPPYLVQAVASHLDPSLYSAPGNTMCRTEEATKWRFVITMIKKIFLLVAVVLSIARERWRPFPMHNMMSPQTCSYSIQRPL